MPQIGPIDRTRRRPHGVSELTQARPSADAAATGAPAKTGALVVVRHGTTTWSLDGRHTGITELSLTPAGIIKAQGLAGPLSEFSFTQVLSSPRRRARRTAELAGFTDPQIDQNLAEWDYGVYEGMTREQIQLGRPGWNIWTDQPPAGESAAEVTARAEKVIERVLPDLAAGRDVAVFSHGHFTRVLMITWAGLAITSGAAFTLDPATISVLGLYRGEQVVKRWNSPGTKSEQTQQSDQIEQSTEATASQ